MKFKTKLLGIFFSFLVTGSMLTASSESSYEEVYKEQAKEVVRIKEAVQSEFISVEDKKILAEDVEGFKQIKSSETKEVLRTFIKTEKKHIAQAEKNVSEKEKQVATEELSYLTKDMEGLDKKGTEAFVLNADIKELNALKKKIDRLGELVTVKPVRELSTEFVKLEGQLNDNQAQTKQLVVDLKKFNETSEKLSTHNYLLEPDKELIEKDRKNNSQFFNDADDIEIVKTRHKDSKRLVETLQIKATDTETDFKAHEESVKELIKLTEALLKNGNLTKEEKSQLTDNINLLKNTISFKDYVPGDLGSRYKEVQDNFKSHEESSNKRLAELKKKAEQEAKEQAKREEEARKKAEQEAKVQAQHQAEQESNNQGTGEISLAGDWYQAPQGYKFLKSESGKTYGQVKNPDNFRLITNAEASDYSPGHGNGSAKQ